MRGSRRRGISAVGLLWIFHAPLAPAGDLRCDGHLVSPGARAYDVTALCGEPDAREAHEEDLGDPNYGPVVSSTVEEWRYDAGPSDLVRIVVLRDGVVERVGTGGHGYDKRAPPKRECDERAVRLGDLRGEVAIKCGPPDAVNPRAVTVLAVDRTLHVTLDEWTYDLGPDRLQRILTFENGRLTRIGSGGYGHVARK